MVAAAGLGQVVGDVGGDSTRGAALWTRTRRRRRRWLLARGEVRTAQEGTWRILADLVDSDVERNYRPT